MSRCRRSPTELGVSSADSIWVVNAYQLAIVVSLLSFSTLGDVVGYRRIYIGGLVFFTLSSVGCAFAGSLEMLIAMRVIQGFGGAAVVSINTSIIRIIYPRDQLGRGMGINATVVAIASVAGPTLAGRDSFDGVVALALRHQYSDRHRGRLAQHAFPAVQSRPALRPSLRLARRRNERPDLRAVDRFGRGFFARARSAHRGLRRVGVLRGGLSLRAQPASETLSVAAVRSAAHSDLFALGFHVDLAPSSRRCWLWWHCRSSYRRSWVTATSRPDFCSRRGQP